VKALLAITVTALCAVTVAIRASYCYGSDTELVIRCDKQTYLVMENIWIDVLLVNHGEDTVTVPIPSMESGGLGLRVWENGTFNRLQYGTSLEYPELPTRILVPGDTLYYQIDFSDTYPFSISSTRSDYIPLSGEIKVVSACASGDESDTLRFTIDKPAGKDIEPYNLLMKGLEHPLSDEACGYYAQVVERFPESVYAAKACQKLILDLNIRSPLGAEEKIIYYSRLIISHYTDKGDLMLALSNLKGYGHLDERMEVVEKLATSEYLRHRMIAKAVREGMIDY
jgi:hypothetical protein